MELWTSATPNGWKVSIMVEELIEAGIDMSHVSVRSINLGKGEQFSDEFTARNPNQKIPVLRDGERDIPESCAILQYLAEKYPTPLLPLDERRWDVLPWVYWQAANVGPVFGNKLSYTRYMPDVPDEQKVHPLARFGNEALRLVSVLDRKLGDAPWVCGESFTIADIALFPWLRAYKWSRVDITTKPRVVEWVHRVRARPGVERGIAWGVPKDEIDSFSKDRRQQYAKAGSMIAANDSIKGNVDP